MKKRLSETPDIKSAIKTITVSSLINAIPKLILTGRTKKPVVTLNVNPKSSGRKSVRRERRLPNKNAIPILMLNEEDDKLNVERSTKIRKRRSKYCPL